MQDTDDKMLREEIDTLQKSSADAQVMLQEANKKHAIAITTVESQSKELVSRSGCKVAVSFFYKWLVCLIVGNTEEGIEMRAIGSW